MNDVSNPALGDLDGALPQTLGEVVDALLECESSSSLIRRLGLLLEAAGAQPAQLYLADLNAQVFYPAAGFGCERGDTDLPFSDGTGPNRWLLRSRQAPVGLLETAQGADPAVLERLAAILGPVLVHLNRQEVGSQQLQEVREQMAHLLSAGELLRHLDVEVLLVKILETVLTAVRAQVGAVLVPDAMGVLKPRVTWGLQQKHIDHILLADGRRLAEVVAAKRQVHLFDAQEIAAQLDLSGLNAQLTGLLALPLTARDATKGVVLLANPEHTFGPAERRLAETVCTMAAIALDNALLVQAMVEGERLKQEMDLARSVQAGMFPTAGLKSGTLVVEGHSRPCSETGGDYLAYMERNGRVAAMIGDVSGHGLGAALYTTMAHVITQQQMRSASPLETCFKILNESLYHTQSGRFMTSAMLDMNPATGEFTYVSAGHNPLLWIHGGEIRWLDSCGFPLGIMDGGEWPLSPSAILDPDDLLILYTDGFPEAINDNGEAYGEDRLVAMAMRAWDEKMSPTATMQLINSDVDSWMVGKPHGDDLTMIVLRRG